MKKELLLTLTCLSLPLSATQITYTPVNPSFGGNALNGTFLLSKAQSQNDHTEDYEEASFVEQFQDALERNLLYSLTSDIANGDFASGTYNTGEYIVQVIDTDPANVVVQITDIATGEMTEIIMPRITL
ncbi:curli assembly protein CsgF [Ferrimonas lipolytica]|uniref:Curli production assembly/transport component CsgF n=1 Tax=Ferrimonas lipolytica TaxID=2724191 RepID=A0A6H1UDJ8_9GAMM|nr:curli assembly protein CsgF [Ferrimonas lipolytica]QIZ77151.1 curli production assembly protein CsgF [Ferrimonas lipolytica]